MDKQEFLAQLRTELSGLPRDDIEERLTFYSEMIDDRIEEGYSEEEAVAAIGSIDGIIAQVIADIPLTRIAKGRMKPKRRTPPWQILLLVMGFPIWGSLLIAAAAVGLAIYVSLWAVIVSLWAVFASLAASGVGFIASGIILTFGDNILAGIALIGTGIICAGLSIFMFCGSKAATKGILTLTKMTTAWIKNCFIKKEDAS